MTSTCNEHRLAAPDVFYTRIGNRTPALEITADANSSGRWAAVDDQAPVTSAAQMPIKGCWHDVPPDKKIKVWEGSAVIRIEALQGTLTIRDAQP